VLFSALLYEKDYDSYKERYEDEYLPSLEQEDVEETAEKLEPEPVEPKAPVSAVEDLTSDFDEDSFWTPATLEEIRDFAQSEELDLEKLKPIINDYLAFDKSPRSSDLLDAYTGRIRLKEWAMMKGSIKSDLMLMVERLSTTVEKE